MPHRPTNKQIDKDGATNKNRPTNQPTDMGVYKESYTSLPGYKKTRKKAFNQESDQEKKTDNSQEKKKENSLSIKK